MGSRLHWVAPSGKSNLCPPPLLWRDWETAGYFKALGKRTRSTRMMMEEFDRLREKSMKCEVGERTYHQLMQHAVNKPDTVHKLWDMMKEAKIPPGAMHYQTLVQVHGKRRDLEKLVAVISEMRASNIALDANIYQHLMTGFARCGKAHMAHKVMEAARRDGIEFDTVFYRTAIAVAPTVAAGEEVMEAMVRDGIQVKRPHRIALLSPCLRELDAAAAEGIIADIGLCAISASRLLAVYEKTASDVKLAALVERMLTERKKLKLDRIFFHAAMSACCGLAVQARDEWILRAETCFDAFVELEHRHHSMWEPFVLTLSAVYVRLHDAASLQYFRRKLQNEGFYEWTRLLLDKRQHVEGLVDTTMPLPEAHRRRSYSKGVSVAARYAKPLPFW